MSQDVWTLGVLKVIKFQWFQVKDQGEERILFPNIFWQCIGKTEGEIWVGFIHRLHLPFEKGKPTCDTWNLLGRFS